MPRCPPGMRLPSSLEEEVLSLLPRPACLTLSQQAGRAAPGLTCQRYLPRASRGWGEGLRREAWVLGGGEKLRLGFQKPGAQ